MLNTSDLIFLLVSLGIIAISYVYFKRNTKPRTTMGQNPLARQPQNPDPIQAPQPQPQDLDQDIPRTKADMLKEARKREKKEQKEAQRREVERQQKLREERLVHQDDEEEKEKEREEKEKVMLAKLEEEQRKKEEEEYNKWKDLIELETQGVTAEEENTENLLAKFIEYIKVSLLVKEGRWNWRPCHQL